MYNFDEEIIRTGTGSVKWDSSFITENTAPMWVADMDFKTAPAIQRRLKHAVDFGIYGYKLLTDKYYNAVINWMGNKHGMQIKKEWIVYIPNVVAGLSLAVNTISRPGDEIIIFTPVYGPFFEVINKGGRTLIECPMKESDGYYTLCFEDLEKKITDKTKAIIFCNPHNPVGRVWKEEELKEVARICEKHDLWIISDNIHCDIIRAGERHRMMSLVSPQTAARTIEFTSPSKAFNLAGIHVANAIISNLDLRKAFQQTQEFTFMPGPNIMSEEALIGAYEESDEWLEQMNAYLDENVEIFVNYIRNLPNLKVRKPEGTYLAWLDCRKLGISPDKIREYFRDKFRIEINEGTYFGKSGAGFVRVNLACPRSRIEDVLRRLSRMK